MTAKTEAAASGDVRRKHAREKLNETMPIKGRPRKRAQRRCRTGKTGVAVGKPELWILPAEMNALGRSKRHDSIGFESGRNSADPEGVLTDVTVLFDSMR